MSVSLSDYTRAAIRAAKAAGVLLARSAGKPRTVRTKRHAADLVTEVDAAAERLIQTILRRADPTCGFLGEEHGHRRQDAPDQWIVDPLDGTINFVHGLPLFAVSIGLAHRGRLLLGVIFDPMRRELFVAAKGGGASLNGRRIHVSATRRLSGSLLSTGFSSQFNAQPQPYLGWFQALQRRTHGVRRIGSTAISLAAVAAGRLDGFYELDLWPWDTAAGILLVEEAGGRVSDFAGDAASFMNGRLVASNGHVHQELLRVLSTGGARRGKRGVGV